MAFVNDLVTNVSDKPLSAAQGVALKSLTEELRALIPEAYTLPIATEDTLGGVKPVTATDAMTQPVGVTAEGRLVTKPGEGGSGIAVTGATVGQTILVASVDDNGVPTAWEPVDFPKGGHWETIYEYVSDNIVVTDFSITYDEENKYSILTVPDGVLSEFNVGDNVILAIFPLDGTSQLSNSYITGIEYDIRK